MAFKTTARAAGHRLQTLWRYLRQQVPVSIHIHIGRRGSAGCNSVSKSAISTLVATDHLHEAHSQRNRLVVVNPDPEPGFGYEPSMPEPEPNPMSLSTVLLAQLLMDTDRPTPQQEEQLYLTLCAGYAAQDARPIRYSPSGELLFDV